MVKKDILMGVDNYDLLCAILLTKPKSAEGCGRFDARRLYHTLQDISKNDEKLASFFRVVETDGSSPGSGERIEAVLSLLCTQEVIYQFQDELDTEIYYLNRSKYEALGDSLEKRRGMAFLRGVRPLTERIWKRYDALTPKRRYGFTERTKV